MLSVKEYKHDHPVGLGTSEPIRAGSAAERHAEPQTAKMPIPHTMTQRRAVMLIANHTTPLLGSRAKATEAAWAFVKKGGAVTKAVGVSFGDCQSALRRLEQHPVQDVAFQLVREPENPYDSNAVRIDGYVLKRFYPDSAGEVKPLERHTNASSHGKSGCDEWGIWQTNKSKTLVGHLPRELAAMLAPLMDRGVAFRVTQYAIYGGGTGYSLGVKLRIRFAPVQAERREWQCQMAG